ncbi:MAG: hypothetical protein JWO62_689, partial [Acidimicrobiaceae bacterium]|nr:hypothetical protein [Acidimicrobiaceae bacterium]
PGPAPATVPLPERATLEHAQSGLGRTVGRR